jgi:hypothetical protein
LIEPHEVLEFAVQWVDLLDGYDFVALVDVRTLLVRADVAGEH